MSAISQLLSQYGGYVIEAVLIVGAGYLLYGALTDDGPCADERERMRAYEITLRIPEAPDLDDDEAVQRQIAILDDAERRYPDLYNEYEIAASELVGCELSQ